MLPRGLVRAFSFHRFRARSDYSLLSLETGILSVTPIRLGGRVVAIQTRGNSYLISFATFPLLRDFRRFRGGDILVRLVQRLSVKFMNSHRFFPLREGLFVGQLNPNFRFFSRLRAMSRRVNARGNRLLDRRVRVSFVLNFTNRRLLRVGVPLLRCPLVLRGVVRMSQIRLTRLRIRRFSPINQYALSWVRIFKDGRRGVRLTSMLTRLFLLRVVSFDSLALFKGGSFWERY